MLALFGAAVTTAQEQRPPEPVPPQPVQIPDPPPEEREKAEATPNVPTEPSRERPAESADESRGERASEPAGESSRDRAAEPGESRGERQVGEAPAQGEQPSGRPSQLSDERPGPRDGLAQGGRPRIGLVLSGGGARGAAHIGVLKVLDELRVPIDAIAGTSMGAVVGGLYATGFSAQDIERIVSTLDWQDAFRDRPPRAELTFRRKQEDQNFLVKFPLGIRSGNFLLPKGLIQGQKLNQTLRKLTLPVARIENFDNLPTPFRAVATDLETGAAVVMNEGDLTSAVRASLSAPGVFSPVEREGRLLVDGGLAENLPIDVARQMGVDVLIVVDVGFPLLDRKQLDSAPVISNQMLAILIRKDSDRQRATLTERDIVIDPPIGEFSSFDFSQVKWAIEKGEEGARAVREKLAAYSVSPDDYSAYMVRREDIRSGTPRIDFVRVEPGSERYTEALLKLFDDTIGKPVDAEDLGRRITGYYGRGNLEALDYTLVKDENNPDRYGLALTARRNSWGPNYIRFGLNLQDDFEGNSSYNAAARFVLSEITQPGGEWVWDLQVGEISRFATEIYLPFSQSGPYFVQPHAAVEARNVPILNDDQQSVLEYRVRSTAYGLDFGREFSNWGELRAGYLRDKGRSRVRVGDPDLPTSDFDLRGYFLRMSYDRLDDVNFPRHGASATLEWGALRDARLEDRHTADRVSFDWILARTFGRQTAVLWTSLGTALNEPVGDPRTLFPLGGFLNLSGVKPDAIRGPHFGITRLLLYRQIGRGGPGFLDVPAYLGVSLEAGNVWERRSDASFGDTRKNASLFLGLDTPIGPVYLGTGFEEGGSEAFYLFLGRTF